MAETGVVQSDAKITDPITPATPAAPVAPAVPATPAEDPKTEKKEGGGVQGEVPIVTEGLLGRETQPKAQGEAGKEDGKPLATTEVKYEDFKIAEGLRVDDDFLGTAKAKFAELGLTQQQAQELIDLQNQLMLKQDQTLLHEVGRQTQELVKKWEDEVRADEELGGANLAEKIAVAKSAATALDCEEIIGVLQQANLGSNPAVIRFLYRAGKALGEGKYVVGKQAAGTKPLAELLYEESKMK